MADQEEQQRDQPQETAQESPSVLDEIMQETKLKPADESYGIAKRGLEAFLKHLIDQKGKVGVKAAVVNEMIAEVDSKLSDQVNEIMHHEQYQKLESAWRGLKMVVDKTDFRENNKIEILNVSKEELLEDFEDAPEIVKSGLYKTVYTDNYGVFGGEPVGAMIANYDFGPGAQDVSLLQYCASVASMSHAPFLAAAGPQFLGEEDFLSMPNLKDIKGIFEGPQYAKWHSFRESEDARSVGLCVPRFLLRLPYGKETVPVKAFNFEEEVTDDHGKYLWGNAAYAFGSNLTESFAKYRFSSNIIGPKGGGAVEDLPLHVFESMGQMESKIPTEVLISERREFELSEEGFIPLTMRKGSDNACFFSANSCQKPKTFGKTKEGKQAETNYKLGTRLPYMLVINRLAHYIKVLQREEIGSTKSRMDLEKELNQWIGQYVLDMDTAQSGSYARRPLRKAEITVEDVAGEPGWYKIGLKVVPHFKYEGAFFELSLVGKLDKAK
jgi:type VI secretion system protein ImpC